MPPPPITPPQSAQHCLSLLSESVTVEQQMELRRYLPAGEAYYTLLARAYFANPFLELTPEEIEHLSERMKPDALVGLVRAREAATRSPSPKYSVCCMPKSGSSFVQSGLERAFQLPVRSLTSFGAPKSSSRFGMNSREQEIDEMALVSNVLAAPRGFIAQNHTRYSIYLGLLYRRFNVTPIVTVRNILDCIVSFDEMMVKWRRSDIWPAWISDAQFALPLSYPDLTDDVRYGLLARTFGIWLISFYVSWKRCAEPRIVRPVTIRYEDHVLDPTRFTEHLSDALKMTSEQRSRLLEYAQAPNRSRSRLNVGVKGRGAQRIPPEIQTMLREHASSFEELTTEDIDYLVGPDAGAGTSAQPGHLE